jgi:hypothetical protein
MLQLKNRLHQPLALQCAGGKSIHLLSRGTATIQERDMSADIQRAIRKGLVSQKTLPGTVSRAIPKAVQSFKTTDPHPLDGKNLLFK